MDAARAWRRREPGASPWHADLGAGVRFGEPGSTGVVRLDVAIGLRDRQTAISAGYVPPWGR
jgi:outer membrane translocation and assembly module TamA